MRTLVDIEDQHVRELDTIAARERRSRASLVREALAEYLSRKASTSLDEAFGLWGDRKTDGLAYQEKVRSEW